MEGKNNRRYNNNNFNTYNSSNNINNYDSDEVKEAMEKLKEERKKNSKLKKENLELYSNILSLKSTAKEKINPIPPSRENNFPKFEDLKKKINLFTNIETLKFFNKNLKDQNLNNDGFKFFFLILISNINIYIENHFNPLYDTLKSKLQTQKINDPLTYVLNLSYQNNWKMIYDSIANHDNLNDLLNLFMDEFDIKSEEIRNNFFKYIKKIFELLFKCYINIPQIYWDYDRIGVITYYDINHMEKFEENKIISKYEKIFVILPNIFYIDEERKKEIISKEKVINANAYN